MYFRTQQPTFVPIKFKPARWLVLCVYMAVLSSASARNNLDASNPLGFFTTVADKLLRSTFNFGVTNIPVYSNGACVYSPAVQRMLQLSANVYDATTTNFYPSVFRPLFSTDATGTNVFISGYQQVVSVTGVNDLQLAQPLEISALASPGVLLTNSAVNVYGIPWIIGAKMGFPAFNQLSMINSAQFLRQLEVVRTTESGLPTLTNQMVRMSINNSLGVSFWNSYSNDYVGTGNISICVNSSVQMTLTNSVLGDNNPYVFLFNTNLFFNISRWSGSQWNLNGGGLPQASSFISSVWTNTLVPNGVAYNFLTGGFISTNAQNAWDSTLSPLPAFGLQTTNWLQAFILDGNNVIDYVQLCGPIDSTNLTTALQDAAANYFGGAPYYLWSTNGYGIGGWPSLGIENQLIISGSPVNPPASAIWEGPLISGLPGTILVGQEYFAAAFTPSHAFSYNGKVYYNTQLVSLAPYAATRTIFVPYLYQVNDPLVHYLASDLSIGNVGIWQGADILPNGVWMQNNGVISSVFPVAPANNIAHGQSCYQPWGQTVPTYLLSSSYDFSNPYNLSYKDPLVWGSDYWDFPTNLLAALDGLGQLHRGTPWQTIYLKSSDILRATGTSADTNTWMAWTGDYNASDAAIMAPVNDGRLAGLLISLLNTNDATQLLSVNDPNILDWLNALNGLTVFSNSVANASSFSIPQFDTYLMASNSPQALAVANGIAEIRVAVSHQVLYSIGDILAASALAESSPWLNTSAVNQLEYGISDTAYEAIPSQLLLLVRPDSFGTILPNNGGLNLQFSGSDGYAYEVQTSTDLVNWIIVSTNYPVGGSFSVPIPSLSNSQAQFFRTLLLP